MGGGWELGAGMAFGRVGAPPGIVSPEDADRDPGDGHNRTAESRIGLRCVEGREPCTVEDGDDQSDESQSLPFHDLSVPAPEATGY